MFYQWPEYGSIPQSVRDITASKVKLLDEYILFQTDDGEYTALIHDMVTGDVRLISFILNDETHKYVVSETEGEWNYTITNEYYCYSNVGLGAALDLPVYDGVQAHASVVFTVVLMFLVVFRSSLFPFRKKK